MERLAVATGGTRGLGKAIAVALRERRCRVVVTCRGEGPEARCMEECGIPVEYWDAADFEACRAGWRGFVSAWGRSMVAAVRPDVLQSMVAGISVGRLGDPGDVARLVVFLADEAGGFITGATFDVNGGRYMAWPEGSAWTP